MKGGPLPRHGTAQGANGATHRDDQPLFTRRLPAKPDAVRDTLMALRKRFAAHVDPDPLGRAELVLAEVLNNIAEHGRSAAGTQPFIHLTVIRYLDGLACAITDDAAMLPPDLLRGGALPNHDPLPEGGFGWFLIRDLTQELCYLRENGRNMLAFRIPPAGHD